MQVNLPKVKLQYRQELQEALTSIGESINATETKHISGRNNINLTSIVKTDSRGWRCYVFSFLSVRPVLLNTITP